MENKSIYKKEEQIKIENKIKENFNFIKDILYKLKIEKKSEKRFYYAITIFTIINTKKRSEAIKICRLLILNKKKKLEKLLIIPKFIKKEIFFRKDLLNIDTKRLISRLKTFSSRNLDKSFESYKKEMNGVMKELVLYYVPEIPATTLYKIISRVIDEIYQSL